MKRGLLPTLSLAAALVLCATGFARGEVWVELDGSGHVVSTHVPSRGSSARVWRITGEAPSTALVLNAAGASRGDGRPDVAIDPVSGFPRAVWAMRTGGGFDVVTSTFDGSRWSEPIPVTSSFGVDDLDPKIAFRADGLVLVAWWTNTASPVVQLAFLPRGGHWIYTGVVSAPAVRAKIPAIRQSGNLTIIAYRTPTSIQITPLTIVTNEFGDGPTPFPRDDNHGAPTPGDEPPPEVP